MKPSVCLAAALLVALAGCNVELESGKRSRVGETRSDTVAFEKGKVELVRAELEMRAGELQLSGGSAKLFEGTFRYNREDWKPEVRYDATGFRGNLFVKQGGRESVLGSDVQNRWEMKMSDDLPADLIVRLGAGESKLTLGSMSLRSVEFNMGAGKCDVDLRGTPKKSYRVEIRGGVGEANVFVSKAVGIVAEAQGGLGEINVSGLMKDGGRWVSEAYGKSPVTIELDVRGGVGAIHIRAD